ncbi:DUF6343 family protein [Microbispora sp. NPDC046933]|uniref:DUF6343 family protein n=1 Tax=Microbispora sp. NPDC046933 TaxID=3155618 RepID=UPI0034030164
MEKRHSGRTGSPPGAPSLRDRFWSVFSPTTEPPRSALGLRMALAAFGLVVCGFIAITAYAAGLFVPAVVATVLAIVAAADFVVVVRRRAGR